MTTTPRRSFIVLGGEGFVGQAIIKGLCLTFPNDEIISLGPTKRFHSSTSSYTFISTDITSLTSITKAFTKTLSPIHTLFHTVSPHPTSNLTTCYNVNVTGTNHLITACYAFKVKHLVFTSSVTVVFQGEHLINVDERMPTTQSTLDHYVTTKAQAEKLVLAANGQHGLSTISLRLSGIIGPGDRQVIPGMIKVLHDGQTAFQIGNNDILFDFVHIDNVVHAHILASIKLDQITQPPLTNLDDRLSNIELTVKRRKLPISTATDVTTSTHVDPPLPAARNQFDQFSSSSSTDSHSIAGEAFIITNGEPVAFWSFTRAVWFAYNGHVPKFTIPIPRGIAMGLAVVSEQVGKLMGMDVAFTTSNVRYVTSHMYFNIEKARRVLGYEPIIGIDAGIISAVEWYKADELERSANTS